MISVLQSVRVTEHHVRVDPPMHDVAVASWKTYKHCSCINLWKPPGVEDDESSVLHLACINAPYGAYRGTRADRTTDPRVANSDTTVQTMVDKRWLGTFSYEGA